MELVAVFFDLDGVLINACEMHYQSLNRALKEAANYEIPIDDHLTTFNGLPTKTKLQILINRKILTPDQTNKVWDLKQKYTIEVIKETMISDPIKIELHQTLKALGLKIGCVTNSIRETATLMLEQTGQMEFMDLLVCNEDTEKNKPDPAPYLFAMSKLGVSPSQVMIVEDSDTGWKSACSSGAGVLMRVSGYEEVVKERIVQGLR